MRCISCNKPLNDFESTRKYEDGSYVDMCKGCFSTSDLENIIVIDRADLSHEDEESTDSDKYDITDDYMTLTAPMGWPNVGE